MVTVKQLEGNNVLSTYATAEQSKCPCFSLEGIKIPVYQFGSETLIDNNSFREFLCNAEEEQSILDSLLLAQWEDCIGRGCFKFDVATTEIKVISGMSNFVAQLNEEWTLGDFPKFERNRACIKGDTSLIDWMKHHKELLFCVTHGDKANSEFFPSAAVPNGAILIIVNTTPVEYGHIFLVPHGSNKPYQVSDARSLDIFSRLAVEINNCSFRLFYDYSRCASLPYFQACYFSNPLPVELMSVHTLFHDGQRGIYISSVIDYPIKTLLFESNENLKILVEILAEICCDLQGNNVPHNLLISDHGKKVFLFLQIDCSQLKTLANSDILSAWECGGYFLFKSRNEFNGATEEAMLQHLSTVSLDDEDFQSVKQFCCNVANKFVS